MLMMVKATIIMLVLYKTGEIHNETKQLDQFATLITQSSSEKRVIETIIGKMNIEYI